MKLNNLLMAALIFIGGCSADKTPSQTYSEYNSKVISGLEFNDDKAYYTKRKVDEIELKFPQYMKKMKKSREEVIEFYLRFSREQAKCKELTLVSENIDGDIANLEYSQKDICGNESSAQEKQLIRIINEGGWKIDDIEISL